MLTIEQLSKSYGEKVLFDQIRCTITDTDRIGVIGVNVTGKSSLLEIIAGRDTPDAGSIQHAQNYRIEYLAQEPELDLAARVIEQMYYGVSDVMREMRSFG